ncbi:hypothetical protein ASF28_09470 [Methylobacterium sp. Leaf99]|uniref:hypothetical protein n=1 Tax=Methylobacterium sp. Leaf99 TaxID=1736251 RepID=UPI0006FBB755|nr:hypothetical protein [Methylobacterium sp. Leaf99]KQP11254.1 hypothetical protein ASF28_09470 [Methylobacterium sp. Leaf99]
MPAFARLLLPALVFALGAFPGAAPAGAAGPLRRDPPTAPARPDGPSTAWTSAEPEPLACAQTRRKLWRPGEGWTVKTVTTCR